MKKSLVLAMLTLSLLSLANLATADVVKISGSSTVFSSIVLPGKGAVEKSTGHTLQLVSSNTGKGLAELANGTSDIAMVSEPMEIASEAAQAAGKKIDVKTMQFIELKKDEIVFVVHPSNSVTKLTWEQLRDIFTGKISNWKDVGGKDLAIVMYGEGPTGGTRNMIKKFVFGGAEFGAGLKAQTSIKRAGELLGNDVAGIAGIGKSFVDAAKNKVIETKKLERPLALVTLATPSPAVKAVVDAFAKETK
jgi:phosphate transport system substrate-binding protein